MWYEIVIYKGDYRTESIVSFPTKTEAERVAMAFRRYIDGKLVVAKEVGENDK